MYLPVWVFVFAPGNLCGFPGFLIEFVVFGPLSGTHMPMGGPK